MRGAILFEHETTQAVPLATGKSTGAQEERNDTLFDFLLLRDLCRRVLALGATRHCRRGLLVPGKSAGAQEEQNDTLFDLLLHGA